MNKPDNPRDPEYVYSTYLKWLTALKITQKASMENYDKVTSAIHPQQI